MLFMNTSHVLGLPVPDAPIWVQSLGGPLVVVPVDALSAWGGAAAGRDDSEHSDDYDRACAVDGWAGVLPIGDGPAQALVLGDEPATTCYLPDHRLFVRWIAADSEPELLAATAAHLVSPLTEWEECGVWETSGPALLMDSATPGAEVNAEYPNGGGLPEQAPVPITAGRWRTRAAYSKSEGVWANLVHLVPE